MESHVEEAKRYPSPVAGWGAPSEGKVRLAVIGCGAIAKIAHLPAIARSDRAAATVLVDQNLAGARDLARRYGIPQVLERYDNIKGAADGAVVALPNYLHAPVAVALLTQGIPVLVEKPMALSTAECDAMIEASETSGAALAVGMEFRFSSASRFVKELFTADLIGRIRTVDARLGLVFDWPLESDYLFHKDKAGGGVLIDFGVHVLDLLQWWLGGFEDVSYFDDAAGGVEANCELRLELANGASGIIELSRTRRLRNSCTFRGERGRLDVELWKADPVVRLSLRNGEMVFCGRIQGGEAANTMEEAFGREIDDFAEAIRTGGEPLVGGRQARRTIRLIEKCYARREPLRFPWSF